MGNIKLPIIEGGMGSNINSHCGNVYDREWYLDVASSGTFQNTLTTSGNPTYYFYETVTFDPDGTMHFSDEDYVQITGFPGPSIAHNLTSGKIYYGENYVTKSGYGQVRGPFGGPDSAYHITCTYYVTTVKYNVLNSEYVIDENPDKYPSDGFYEGRGYKKVG